MLTESEVADMVQRKIIVAGSLRALAREWGVSPAALSDLTNGRRGPGPKILIHLNLRRVVTVTYQPMPIRRGE